MDVDRLSLRAQGALMSGPEPLDRKTTGAGESGPDAAVADTGPPCNPESPSSTRAGKVHRGQATGRVTLAHETSVTAKGVGEATHADRTDSPSSNRPSPAIAGYQIEGELGRGGMGV